MKFVGPEYCHDRDHDDLSNQLARVVDLMKDGEWRTFQEIADILDMPQASVSSQMRNCRLEENGGYEIERRRRDGKKRLFEYQLISPAFDRPYYSGELERRQRIVEEMRGRLAKAEAERDNVAAIIGSM